MSVVWEAVGCLACRARADHGLRFVKWVVPLSNVMLPGIRPWKGDKVTLLPCFLMCFGCVEPGLWHLEHPQCRIRQLRFRVLRHIAVQGTTRHRQYATGQGQAIDGR